VARLTVSGEALEEEIVSDCVTGEFNETVPKFKLVAFRFNALALGPRIIENVALLAPVLAVSVTEAEVLTELAVAAKPALVAPAGIVTEAGTETALLLLAR
jgi:hypothetical protein